MYDPIAAAVFPSLGDVADVAATVADRLASAGLHEVTPYGADYLDRRRAVLDRLSAESRLQAYEARLRAEETIARMERHALCLAVCPIWGAFAPPPAVVAALSERHIKPVHTL